MATDPDLQSKNKNPLAAIEDEKVQHEEKMARMETEMGAVLETKVGERRGQMAEVTRREEETVTRDQGLVTRAREEIRDKRGDLERERVEWTTRCVPLGKLIKKNSKKFQTFEFLLRLSLYIFNRGDRCDSIQQL